MASQERLDAFLTEAKALYAELHEENDVLDHDDELDSILPDLITMLINNSDRGYGTLPLDKVLAQFFGIVTHYAYDPDILTAVREVGS